MKKKHGHETFDFPDGLAKREWDLTWLSIVYNTFINKFPVTLMWSDTIDENLFRLTYVVERRGGGINVLDF